jgi:hypothetical protein
MKLLFLLFALNTYQANNVELTKVEAVSKQKTEFVQNIAQEIKQAKDYFFNLLYKFMRANGISSINDMTDSDYINMFNT